MAGNSSTIVASDGQPGTLGNDGGPGGTGLILDSPGLGNGIFLNSGDVTGGGGGAGGDGVSGSNTSLPGNAGDGGIGGVAIALTVASVELDNTAALLGGAGGEGGSGGTGGPAPIDGKAGDGGAGGDALTLAVDDALVNSGAASIIGGVGGGVPSFNPLNSFMGVSAAGAGGSGVSAGAGASLSNRGGSVIAGGDGGSAGSGNGGAGGAGVSFAQGITASLTNQDTASIAGGNGGASGTPFPYTIGANGGNGGDGVDFHGATLINQDSATITGGNGAAALAAGSGGAGVAFWGSLLQNTGDAKITGGAGAATTYPSGGGLSGAGLGSGVGGDGVVMHAASSELDNSGAIAGGARGGSGVRVVANSAIVNSGTGTITGADNGDGVTLVVTGSLTNEDSASIVGGIGGSANAFGSAASGGVGVRFEADGFGYNENSATIKGGDGETASFNYTLNSGTGGMGVALASATFYNQYGGAVSGGDGGGDGDGSAALGGSGGVGVELAGAAANLINFAATITGGAGGVGQFLGGSGGAGVDGTGVIFNFGAIQGGIAGVNLQTSGPGLSAGVGGAGISGHDLAILNYTTIAGGASDSGLGDAITFTGGTNSLGIGVSAVFTGAIDIQSGVLTFNQFAGGIALSNDATVSTTIIGAGAVAKVGSTTLTLSGANTFSGGATLTEGAIVVGDDAALGAGALAMAQGTILGFAGDHTVANAISIAGDPTFEVASGETETLMGAITDADTNNPGVVEKIGAGKLILADGASNYSGGTTIAAGTLELAVADTLTNSVVTSGGAGTGAITFAGNGGQPATLALTSVAQPGDGGTFGNSLIDFGDDDAIDLESLAYTSGGNGVELTVTNNLLSVTENGATESFILSNPSAQHYYAHNDGAGGTLINDAVACYCPGGLILTERGEVAVEDLRIGERVVTAAGVVRPIKWIGTRAYSARFARNNADAHPICFKAGSLADDTPHRDLWVSPKHAMFLDDVLIPAERLVNGVTVVRPPPSADVRYFHVELDSHDVLVVNGAASESFVDDYSRAMFHNAASYAALYPDARREPAIYCAPRVEDGHALERVRRRLAERAGLPVAPAIDLGALDGEIESLDAHGVSGWARSAAFPDAPVCLDVRADGELIGYAYAQKPRAGGGHAFALRFAKPLDIARICVSRSADGAVLARAATAGSIAA